MIQLRWRNLEFNTACVLRETETLQFLRLVTLNLSVGGNTQNTWYLVGKEVSLEVGLFCIHSKLNQGLWFCNEKHCKKQRNFTFTSLCSTMKNYESITAPFWQMSQKECLACLSSVVVTAQDSSRTEGTHVLEGEDFLCLQFIYSSAI